MNVDGSPRLGIPRPGFARARWCASVIGRGPAGLALKQHVKTLENSFGNNLAALGLFLFRRR
jgi:hypothetical protein